MNRSSDRLVKNRLARIAATTLIAVSALAATAQASAASSNYSDRAVEPRWDYQVMDAVIARPVGIVATGAGAVVWGLSLPFSLLGGNAGQAGDALVGGPARETFWRCLGCRATGRAQRISDTQ